MKKLLKGLLAVVVVIVLVLLLHPLWVGPLVKSVVEKVGPKYTGTPITLAKCGVNLYSGHIELIGFDLANPQGCSEQTAAGLNTLKVDFDTLSALTDVINIRSIEVSGIFASYVKSGSGKYNFTEIGDNAKKATGGSEAVGSKGGEKADQPKAEPAKGDEKVAEKGPAKKVIIERLSVGDVKVAAFGMKMPLLPGTIVLTDIGKKSNGASMSEVWDQTREQILKSSGAAGQQLAAAWEISAGYGQKGLDLGKKGLDAGAEGAKKALDSVKKLDTEGAKKALQGAGDSLKSVGDSFKKLF